MMKSITPFMLLCLLMVPRAHADRGSMPFKPGVKVFEPVQRAMIAWNGKEEILLLTTDLKASEATKVLEVLPLPAEPEVTEGDMEVFTRAITLINRKLRSARKGARALSWEGEDLQPAGEITFHERIGAHDISVAHVLAPAGFVEWVDEYLREQGVDTPVIPETLKDVVEEYIEDDYRWFVFDVVELDEEARTNEAIQYRFRTGSLFYPVKITRTDEGWTEIELLILTPRLLSQFPGISIRDVELAHRPISITADEVRWLSEDIDDLLGHRGGMNLRIWRISGDLASFEDDLIAR
jgi:hypothetical protein